jgi:hypothetical protein
MMRWLLRLIVLVLVYAGAKSLWSHWNSENGWSSFLGKSTVETSHTIVLKEMTEMGKLELAKYSFKDVVEQEIVKTWLPNAKAVLIIQGEAIGCIDLAKIQIEDITSENEILVVNMPDPELCVFKIDHDKSKIYNTEYAFYEEGKLVQEAFKQGEKQIQQSALEMGILDQTKENAVKILTPILEKSSGKKVMLKFDMTGKVDRLR